MVDFELCGIQTRLLVGQCMLQDNQLNELNNTFSLICSTRKMSKQQPNNANNLIWARLIVKHETNCNVVKYKYKTKWSNSHRKGKYIGKFYLPIKERYTESIRLDDCCVNLMNSFRIDVFIFLLIISIWLNSFAVH